MAQSERDLSIVYGNFEVGGDSPNLLTGFHQLNTGFERTTITFRFLVRGDTDEEFRARAIEAETAMRRPYQRLRVTQDGAVLLDLSQEDGTGLEGQPTIRKLGGAGDSGRSRLYESSITYGRPADNVENEGNRSLEVNVAYSPARRRTVTISGVYTAVGSSTAREQYESKIDAQAQAILNALTGTFELDEEPTTRQDTNNSTLQFSRSYREVIFDQGAAGALDDPEIVRQVLNVSRAEVSDWFTPTAHPLVTVRVSYSAWIDKDENTDLEGKWSDIRGWVIEEARTVMGGSAVALVEEAPTYNRDENRIDATLTIIGSSTTDAANMLSQRVTTADHEMSGIVLVPAWDGDVHSRYPYQGPARLIRTITRVARVLGREGGLGGAGQVGGGPGESGGGAAADQNTIFVGVIEGGGPTGLPGTSGYPGVIFQGVGAGNAQGAGGSPGGGGGASGSRGGQWAVIETKKETTPIRIGFDGYILDATDVMEVEVREFYRPISGGRYANA